MSSRFHGSFLVVVVAAACSAPVAQVDTVLDAAPDALVASSDATFKFSGTGDAKSFVCALDGGAFAACRSPDALHGLADGAHHFAVAAVSSTDTRDPTPAVATWTVDTTPPETTIDLGPDASATTATATFFFSSSEPGSTFSCALDGADLAPCTSPKTFDGLADGAHTFSVAASDAAGNADLSPATASWTVTIPVPTVRVTAAPDALSRTGDATFFFVASDPSATFTCQLDEGEAAPCTSPESYSALADGAHAFAVVGTAGGAQTEPATWSWTVDSTPPAVTFTAHPNTLDRSATPTFAFTATEAATFLCRVDGLAQPGCSSPFTTAPLADGLHTFTVVAHDAAGNVDPAPPTFTWTVDTTPPETAIDAGPAATSASASATFAFHGTEALSTFVCVLDGGAPAPCTSPATFGPLADGAHTFAVTATDVAGNTDLSPATSSWTVAVPPPTVHVTSAPEALSRSADASFFFDASAPGATFQCQLDDAPLADCTSPAHYAALADGDHAFSVVATVGAATTAPATWRWTVDTTPPAVTVTGEPPALDHVKTPTFAFTATETATFLCRVDDDAYVACTSPFTTDALADGAHRFRVIAKDTAGNVDPAPPTVAWTLDATPPTTTITQHPGALDYTTSASFAYLSSEPGSTFVCALDGATPGPCPKDGALTGLTEGTHSFTVAAIDPAGNVDPAPPTWSWKVHIAWAEFATAPDLDLSGGQTWTAAIGSTIYIDASTSPEIAVALDTTTGQFAPFAPRHVCNCGYVSVFTAADGKLFNFANDAGSYDPGTNSWSSPPYPAANGEWGQAVLDDVIYFAGGRETPTTVQTYAPATQTWGTVASYPYEVYAPALAASGGKVYGFGGNTAGLTQNRVAVYDPATDAWTRLSDAPVIIPQADVTRSAVAVGDLIYVDAVDEDYNALGLVTYDPSSDAWDTTPIPMPDAGPDSRGGMSLVVADGTLYAVGQTVNEDATQLTVWKFTPAN